MITKETHKQPNAPREYKEIPREIQALDDTLQTLRLHVDEIACQLSPVTRSMEPINKSRRDTEAIPQELAGTELGQMLRKCRQQVEYLDTVITLLLNAVEL